MLTRWMPISRPAYLTRREPFVALQDEVTRLFDDVLRGFGGDAPSKDGERSVVVPRLDLSETSDDVRVEVELPGLSAEDVTVTLEDGVLILSGEFKTSDERNDDTYVHVERRYGSFVRRIPVNAPIDEEHVEATFDKGVLTVRLPKAPEVKDKRRQIAVKSV